MRSLLLSILLVGCVGDDSSTKDAGNDVTSTSDGSTNDVITTSDASDAGDAAAWSPTTFGADLALWVMGDDVSETGGAVDTWHDHSSYKTSPTQLSASNRPLVEKGVLNGHDVVDFNAVSCLLEIRPDVDAGATPANLSFGQADDFVIASVISGSAGMPSAFVWMKAGTLCNGPCSLQDGLVFAADLSANNVSARESTSDSYLQTTNQLLSDHAYHLVVLRRIGDTTLQLRTDTVIKSATITAFDVSEPQTGLTIGASSSFFSGTFAFRMAELIAVHRASGAINDAEVTNIETYLKGKYKTP